MKFGNRIVHNRFILLRSTICLIWALYVSMRLVDFGGAIPKTGNTFILYNTVNSGLVYGFGIVGLLGIYASITPHYMPKLKAGVMIAMLVLWSALAFFYIAKDIAINGFITFSTILICSIAVSILIELWVGEAV